MIPDIVCDDLPEIVFSYRGLRMIQKVNRYEIVEDGRLLAVAKVPAVAEHMGVRRDYISRVLNGGRNPSEETVDKIIAAVDEMIAAAM